jgi:hypothetical protein
MPGMVPRAGTSAAGGEEQAMNNVFELPSRLPTVRLPEDLSKDELVLECVRSERCLMGYERAHDELASALWSDGIEAPAGYVEDGSYEMSDLVAGVQSLHELTDRLTNENEALRARIKELEAQRTFAEVLHA